MKRNLKCLKFKSQEKMNKMLERTNIEQNNPNQEAMEQKNKTIRRITFCIVFALAFYIFLFVYYRDQAIAGNIFQIFLTNIILQTTLTIVIPVILIFRHENMFTFCINYLWDLKKKIKA